MIYQLFIAFVWSALLVAQCVVAVILCFAIFMNYRSMSKARTARKMLEDIKVQLQRDFDERKEFEESVKHKALYTGAPGAGSSVS